jgi:serine phosphatase RsbU (regulator of sigma subunit)
MMTETLCPNLDQVLDQLDHDLAVASPEPACPTVIAESVRPPTHQPKIMVVDDDQLMLALTKCLLRSAGYENVVVADHPSQAISRVCEERPDIVLLDLYMPDCDGFQILKAIRDDHSLYRTAVIMMTASNDYDDKLKALALGVTDFVNKPLHAEELSMRLRNIVKARAFEDSLRLMERQKRLAAEQELRTAEQIQSHLFPQTPPSVRGLDIAGRAYSAGTGCGDYFDFFTLANEHVGLVVGDVTGHGMPSALRMMETRAYLRSLVKFQIDPGGILTELNQFMIREGAYGGDGTEQFVTLFLAIIDPETHQLTYASAGHLAYVFRQSGETLRLESTGLPLGIADLPLDTSPPIALSPGDILVIATDGIEESMNAHGEQFGASRLAAVVRDCQPCTAGNLVEHLYLSVTQFAAGLPQRDDITAMVAIA